MITDEYLQRGIDLARNGELLDAVTVFEEILRAYPDEPRALFNVAVLYDKLGQRNKAFDLLQRSIAIDRSFANPHYYLGYLHLQMGSYKEAYQSFRNTIARDVEFTPAYEGARIAASALGLPVSDEKADIVFYTGGTTAFNGRTLEEKGLGGSESALIYVARALAASGMKVRVFCNCDKPGEYDGIRYGDLVDFHLYRQLNSFPIIISSPSLRPFKIALQTQTRILWIHDDIHVKYLEGETPNSLPIDRIFAVSRWQRDEWARYFHVKQDRFFLTRNGVDLAMFKPGVKRERHRLVYISRPERGLDVLLKLFPMIRNRIPSAELHLYTYYSPGEKSIDEIWRHTQQPGVFIKGCLTKYALAEEIASARLMVYPSTFRETSCIAAIEAQASGTPVVASTLAALPETVLDGVSGRLVPGEPGTDEFGSRFAETVTSLLDDDVSWQRLSQNARSRSEQFYSWEGIAKEWVKEFLRIAAYRNKHC